jgi:GNAT superfamily N-acetyltransferase
VACRIPRSCQVDLVRLASIRMDKPLKLDLNFELPVSNSDRKPIALRPEQPADEAFLLHLYTTTRQEELDLTNWDAATRAAFVSMQFKAMRQGYSAMFPEGQFSIVLLGDLAIGRIVVNHAKHEIRLVDMALTPEMRCRGIGTRLVQALQTEARQTGKPLSLHVLKGNRAARFYERFEFQYAGDAGLYHEMTWSPADSTTQSKTNP